MHQLSVGSWQLAVGGGQRKSVGVSRPQLPSPQPLAPSPYRPAITLIEMLVALAVTLLMMGAVVSIFGWIGSSVSDSRASIEVAERLRAARNRLQLDLQSATAQMDPPRRPESDEGYLEYIEGPITDAYFRQRVSGQHLPNAVMGDYDDLLMLTIRSPGEPFVGRGSVSGTVVPIESQTAEVIWYLRKSRLVPADDAAFKTATGNNAPIQLYNLCRRVLLVYPGADSVPHDLATAPDYIRLNVSAGPRFDSTGAITTHTSGQPLMVPNTLGDLTKRENRYGRNLSGTMQFPFLINNTWAPYPFAGTWPPTPDPTVWSPFPKDNPRYQDDVLLDNVLCFNIQGYDPGTPVFMNTSGTIVLPGDPEYSTSTTPVSYGTYVDLGYALPGSYTPPAEAPVPMFNDGPHLKSKLTIPTYDTWSLHYENNGINEDTDASLVDEGTDGLDNDGAAGAVDDPGEYETQPPYAHRLRGLQVKIRVYEPDSRQVREVTVVQDFLPQ